MSPSSTITNPLFACVRGIKTANKSLMMAESFRELSNRITMMTDWVALVRAYQDYFDFKNVEVVRLMERVSVFEKRLSECEIRIAELKEY